MWIWLGPLVGVLGIGCILAMVAFVRFWGRASDAGGVRAPNEVPAAALERLEKRKILDPGERIVAYYDATLPGDGSELAMVTTERLVYFNAGRTTALQLGEIADVRHHSEPLIGDVIDVQSDSGETMKVEIAPLNGGDFFLSSLQTAWKRKRVSRAAP
jgi:hypothetical protein